MIPLAAEVLAAANLTVRDLAAVAVGRGPAPYTGLRIALATAQALAFALDVPVWGISDLDVLAADAAVRLGLPQDASLVAALDAKRHEAYWARYRVRTAGRIDGLVTVEGPAVGDLGRVEAASAMVGFGFGGPDGGLATVDPVVLARLAAMRVAAGEDVSSRPLYLRRPDVAVPAGRKRARQ
jgi:tRNA threonylcarbamoyladenosine biosynthesis protein TsaB